MEALTRLVEFTFDHHSRNPDLIRLVMIENIHHGAYLEQSELIGSLPARSRNSRRSAGADARRGLFRDDIEPLELHWQISALSFFNVSNRATFA